MAKEFKSLSAFAKHILKVAESFDKYEAKASEFLGKILEKEAQDKIGHYQETAGPFAAWAPLKESTKKDKERQGYVFNADYNPEYRTGELKESISYSYIPSLHKILLGSTSQIMVYQEEGTRYMAPRSMIGATMYQSPPIINSVMGGMLRDWICNQPIKLRLRSYGSI